MTKSGEALAGKCVLVTAAAAGIGYAIAATLAAAGARLYVCDIDADALARCANEHPDWRTRVCDVADEKQVESLVEDVRHAFGRLDVLVNNAGIAGPTGAVDTLAGADWERTLAVNLSGQFYCAKHAAALLRESGDASIVCISSIAGRLGYAYRTPYAASKWGVVGLMKSLAAELGKDGIRVNAILPGVVEGERIERVIAERARALGIGYEQMADEYRHKASLGSMVTAVDIANTALFLCSAAGASISGQPISVCGNVEAL